MVDNRPSRDEPAIELVDTQEASFRGSGYDARLVVDTTPTSRVQWTPQQPDSDQRSAYDAKLLVDTTPTARVEPVAAPSNTEPSSATSNDQQSAD